MKAAKLAAIAALCLAATGANLGVSPAFAGPPDEREVYEMLKKSRMMRADGMVTRADFLKLMEKRFDAMDKSKKGMLSPQDITKLFDPNFSAQ